MMFSFHIKSLEFAPRLIPTLAALIAFALTMYLGQWQQGRAAEKRGLQAEYDMRENMPPLMLQSAAQVTASETFRKAVTRGHFDAAGQIFIDNKSDGVVVGYHVITPLRLQDSEHYLLVNRGFVPRAATYPTPPKVPVPEGEVNVMGILVDASAKFFELGKTQVNEAINGSVWQNLTVDRYRKHTNRNVTSLLLLASPTDVGLKAQTERPDARVSKHVEYMLTWYSLAATVLILWLVLNTHRYSLANKA